MGGNPKVHVDNIKNLVINDPSREDKLGEEEHELSLRLNYKILTKRRANLQIHLTYV